MSDTMESVEQFRQRAREWIKANLGPLQPWDISQNCENDEEELRAVARDRALQRKLFDAGFAGLCFPREYGGQGLSPEHQRAFNEELVGHEFPSRFAVPTFSPCASVLLEFGTEAQKARHLPAILKGDEVWVQMLSEPGGGSDVAGITTSAVRDGDDWVINGRKIWVSRVPAADFVIVMARTGDGKRHEGITAFIVDKGTKGFEILRDIPMLAGHRTYELVFEDCRIPGKQVLGAIGGGFAPMQLRLIVRRLQIGAWCLGMSSRALQMMVEHAKQRVTFGQKLADRQAIQWWIADAAIKMHACRMMVMDAARKQDQGKDVRNEAAMIKVYATDMASEIIDHAMQTFGAMGVTKELPLHLMAQRVRVMRVYEGPTEVHLMAIARKVLKDAK